MKRRSSGRHYDITAVFAWNQSGSNTKTVAVQSHTRVRPSFVQLLLREIIYPAMADMAMVCQSLVVPSSTSTAISPTPLGLDPDGSGAMHRYQAIWTLSGGHFSRCTMMVSATESYATSQAWQVCERLLTRQRCCTKCGTCGWS